MTASRNAPIASAVNVRPRQPLPRAFGADIARAAYGGEAWNGVAATVAVAGAIGCGAAGATQEAVRVSGVSGGGGAGAFAAATVGVESGGVLNAEPG